MKVSLPISDIHKWVWALFMLTIPLTAFGAKPVKEVASEINECGSLSEPGIYGVAQDLPGSLGLTDSGDCITLETSNITINLNGYTIRGEGSGAGITEGGAELENLRVRDGTISGFAYGVYLANSSDSMVCGRGPVSMRKTSPFCI